jgi:hypothetical protein
MRQQDQPRETAEQLWWLNRPVCLEWPEKKKTSWRLPPSRHLVKLIVKMVRNKGRLDSA